LSVLTARVTVTEYGFAYAHVVAAAGVPSGAAITRFAFNMFGASFALIGSVSPRTASRYARCCACMLASASGRWPEVLPQSRTACAAFLK